MSPFTALPFLASKKVPIYCWVDRMPGGLVNLGVAGRTFMICHPGRPVEKDVVTIKMLMEDAQYIADI